MAQYLVHYGVKGMKWGKRKARLSPGDQQHLRDYDSDANEMLRESYGDKDLATKGAARKMLSRIAKTSSRSSNPSLRKTGEQLTRKIIDRHKKDVSARLARQRLASARDQQAGRKVVLDKEGNQLVIDKNGRVLRKQHGVGRILRRYR